MILLCSLLVINRSILRLEGLGRVVVDISRCFSSIISNILADQSILSWSRSWDEEVGLLGYI